jgi:hypothetical protein
MNDLVIVGVLYRLGHLLEQSGGGARVEGAIGLQAFLQTTAIDEGHAVEGLTVYLTDFVNRNDAGVVDAGDDAGLALEALKRLLRGVLSAST